jgi:hypothetical protein
MFKRMNLKIGSKTIVTPLKATYKYNPVSPINEIYKGFSSEKLNKLLTDENYERTVNSEIKRYSGQDYNFFIIDYTDPELPSPNQIEALSDIQYEYSIVAITPIWSSLVRTLKGDDLLDTYIDLTNKYIEVVETLNNKSILGLIPSRIPRQYLGNIIKNYHDQNITSYIIDFDGRAIDRNQTWMRGFMRNLTDLDILEESLLYSVNANEGKFMKNAVKILAKDFIGSGFGIDILGLNHVRPRMTSEGWERIKQQRNKNIYRLFERDNYAYVRLTERQIKRKMRGLDDSNLKRDIKKYNITEQHKETLELKKRLKEESSIESYIRSKDTVDDSLIKKIKKLRSQTFNPQKELDSFL